MSIQELAEIVVSVIGYTGRLRFDSSKPDGTPRRWLDTARLTEVGWKPRIAMKQGIAQTYAAVQEHSVDARL